MKAYSTVLAPSIVRIELAKNGITAVNYGRIAGEYKFEIHNMPEWKKEFYFDKADSIQVTVLSNNQITIRPSFVQATEYQVMAIKYAVLAYLEIRIREILTQEHV